MRFNRLIFIATLILCIAIFAAVTLGYLLSHLIRGFLPVDILTFLIALFLLVAIVLLIYGLFLFNRRQQSPPPPLIVPPEPIELPVEAPFIRRRKIPGQSSQNSDESELQSQLISMLAGDRAAAERLVNRIKQNHPGRAENWYWQRAIEQVKRDRL
jgi:hypothetical protein